MSDRLLEAFREAYRNLDLLPLLREKELNRFRVDYGGDVIADLEQLVEDDPSGDGKIIFAGHRGCGKSTLLAEFSRQLDDRFFVVFFSIADTIEMSDVNHINILFAIAVRLMQGDRRQPNAVPIAAPKQTLCDVLAKRIPSGLIDPNTAEKIVIYSGGVLRELIRIANECCRICLRLVRREPDNENIKIDDIVLREALNKLRIDFDTRLGEADYTMLETTYQNFRPDDPKAQEFLDLLHGLYVLEYRNADLWYDVHPIVIELLQRRGKI